MIRKILTLGLCVALLAGCKTKFSVNGEYKEMPVVHFLLNQGESYHFLKLNKTFLKEGNAYEYAQDPSMSYFDNVVATVQEIGGLNRTWTLQDTTITNKKNGVFYAPDQKLYYFVASDLNEDASYRLKIDIDNGAHIVKGQTQLVKGLDITYPKNLVALDFAENDVNANGYKTASVSYKLGDGAIFKTQISVNYIEYTSSGQEKKSVLWDLGTKTRSDISTPTTTISANGELFYQFLEKKIGTNPDVIKRTLESIDIVLTAGSEDLYTYMLTNKPTSSLAQSKPTYSNLEGGLGIFSSRATYKQVRPKPGYPNLRALNESSRKELMSGQYTTVLNFCSDHPADASKSYACP